jgi:Niemann-Pick C1 protein
VLIVSNGTKYNVTLDRLCFRPIPGKGCLIESVTEYWVKAPDYFGPTLDLTQSLSDVKNWITTCSRDITNPACRGTLGAPTFPYVVLGGYDGDAYTNATALVVTILLNNNDETEDMAKTWEHAFLNKAAAGLPGLNVVYSAERSVTDELARGSSSDIPTIAISYSIMFIYISLALGRIKFDRMLCVRTKFLLGFASIIVSL